MLLLSRLNSLSKVTRCFSSGFLCSFLCPPEAHDRIKRSADLPTALLRPFFLNGYLSRLYIGVRGESPIDFLIVQRAVNASTHHQSAIQNDLLPCVLSAFGNYFKHSLENVLRPYSVNFLPHIIFDLCSLLVLTRLIFVLLCILSHIPRLYITLSVSRFTSTVIKQGFLLTVESNAGTNIVAVRCCESSY